MLDKICQIANELKEQGNYRVASVLYSIVTDLALQEERQYFANAYEKASVEMQTLQAKLQASGLQRLASEIDVIARDLEHKAIAFSIEDPIQTVLHSYKTIHKLASTNKQALNTNALQEIIDLVESETVSDDDLPKHIKTMTLGLTEQEKRDILYVLEKDYNLTLPLEKIAKKSKKKVKPKTQEQDCLEHAETPKERSECLEDQQSPKLKMERSWPTAPSMWSGFAYEAVIPYHQNSQLNFWSLASTEEKVLKRISRKI